MNNKDTFWWHKPQGLDGVEAYLDRIFKYTGENVWAKIVRGVVRQNLEDEINGVTPDKDDEAHDE